MMATMTLVPAMIILCLVTMPTGKGNKCCIMTSFLLCHSHALNVGQKIFEEEPLSLLIPVNHTAHFSCKIRCISSIPCSCYWGINSTYYSDKKHFEEELNGFHTISHLDNNHCMLILHINISQKINNTIISCLYEPTGDRLSKYSGTADLLVISSKCARLSQKFNITSKSFPISMQSQTHQYHQTLIL